jgi:MYXO-CTERM domain-containing protein
VAACDRNAAAVEGLSEGSHTVRMEARLAGTDVVFSAPMAGVELRCAPATAAGAQTTDDTLPADGCSLSPAQPRSSQGPAGLGLLALALATATRKRWAAGSMRSLPDNA